MILMRNVPAVIFIFAVLCVSNVYAENYEDYLKKGNAAYENFNNEKALEYYNKAYELKPDNYYALYNLAKTYNALGEENKELRNKEKAESYIDEAVKFAEKFRSAFPDSAEPYTQLALAYGNRAMFVGGNDKIKLANKIEKNGKIAIEKDPNDYFPYIIMGIYYRELADLNWFERAFANTFFGSVPEGSFEDAIKMLNKALEIQPRMIVATYQLSKVYRYMDSEAKEKELLKKILDYRAQDFRDKFALKKVKRRLEQLES